MFIVLLLAIIFTPVFLFFEIGKQAKDERKKHRDWWKNHPHL